VRGLVMELVEGPTLADRLEQGRLPVDESLSIARQIAEALEDAHERGIVHRDLAGSPKPNSSSAATTRSAFSRVALMNVSKSWL
jgi:serine/threonine protein kinase